MISRQVVCNDPRVRELLGQFVPTADYPHRYRLGKEAGGAETLEYRLLYGALRESAFGSSMDRWFVQGMYVITPSGKLLAGGNRPLDVESTLGDLRKGLEAYRRMPRAERLLGEPPHPETDRMRPAEELPSPPDGGLVLRSFGRGLDGAVGDFCPLKPEYYQLDRIWYTRAEASGFLPEGLRVGATKEITGPVLDALIQLHLKGGGPQWQRNEVKEARLTSEVIAVSGATVRLRITGRMVLDAESEFNKQDYAPDLVGFLSYDMGRREFTRFELLAFGRHSVAAADRIAGGPATVPYGILFTLNGTNGNDRQAPTRLHAYPALGLNAVEPGEQ